MRKWFTCLFAGLWLFAVQSATAQCSFTGFGLKIESVTATQGQQVCLDVTTQNFTNILGMQFSIHYNQAALQFNNVAAINLNGLSAASFGTPQPGRITMTWNDPDLAGITRPNGTVIYELCFTVIGNTTSTVSFANTPTAIEILDNNLNEVPFNSCPGTVTVNGGGGGDDFSLNIESITAPQGQQVCLNVATEGFTNILGMQFSIQYNSSVLSFVNVSNLNLNGLSAASFGNPSPGVITMTWNDPDGLGITRPDGTVIFELCFTITGSTTSTVSFTNTPTAIEILNNGLQQVPFNSTSGTVTVTGGGGGGNFSLNIESVTAPQGQQVCLNVATQGFTNILGMQFSIQYNSSVLSFVNVSNLNLNGLSAASFGNPSPGVITMTWNDPDVMGITRPNGTVLFELCFTITGSTTSTVSFSNTPTAIEILNSSLQEVPFNSTSGTVTVTGGGGGGNFSLDIESITAPQGQQVCLNVATQGFTNILGMQFSIQYNSSVLSFVNVSNLNLNGLSAASFGNPSPGVITMTWNDPDVVGVTRPNGTVIFELCFTITGTTTSTVSFSNTPTAIEILNSSLQEVPFNSTSGTVTVSGGGGEPTNCNITGFGLEIEDANGTQGQQVCLEVRTHGFNDILGMQFSINYNASVLTFTNVAALNLNGLAIASFGTPSAGTITMTWNDPDVQGITLPNGTVIFELCFNVTGNTTSAVTFGNTPTAIEILNGALVELPFSSCSGTVTLGTIVDPPTTCDITGFGLEIEDVDGTQGQQVCMEVRTHGFNDILGMQFSINYNASVLTFANVAALNLNGLAIASFGTPSPGVITMTWNDPDVMGITLPNGTVIFELCFDVTGNTNSTVTFGNTPTAIEILNGDLTELPFSSCSGTVNLETIVDPPTPCDITGFGLEIESIDAIEDQSFCLEVRTHGFNDILGMQFSINYNPAILQFTGPSMLNLNGLTLASFGTPSPGTITMTWNDGDLQGITLPDGTVIFKLCFTMLTCATSTVTFGNTPTAIEILDGNLTELTFNSCPGTVSCGDPGDEIVTITNANITNVACRGQSTGAITVQATSSGGGTLTYAWSALPNPGNTPTITNRPAGTYSVTVTSSLGGTPATATYMITQPATAVTINSLVVTDVSCNGANDGSILVTASGGTGALSYAWSAPPPNPGNTPNPMNLIPFSFYRVTVTDASGCTAMSMLTEVEEPAPLVVTATSIQNILCAGASTGSVTLSVTGGTGPYTYNWSGTAPDTNPTTGLPAGVYSVTVTDSRGCTQTLNNVNVVALNPALTITNTTVTDLNDGNPGAVNITVQGGNSTYTYVWTGPGGFSAGTQDISNLTVGGQYCVTVTDGNNCTTNTCAMVGEDLAITAFNINKACFGTNNGGVDITVSGGTSPYTYVWRNSSNNVVPGTPQDIINVAPGIYNVTVTDGSNNTVTGNFEVTSLPQINIASNIGSATSGNNGSIALTITGGAPGYTLQWSGTTQTTPTITNLAVGQYCVTITDANFCTATGCYMVTAQPFAFGTVTSTDVLCNGASTGTLAVTVLGGTPPYTLTINGTPHTSATGVFNITGLGANDWPFTVTDNAGATINNNAIITEPSQITANQSVNNDTEDAGCTGSITLNISGGTPGYTVTWNVVPTGPQILSLCAGNYVPTIQDANGCQVTLPAIALNTFSEDAVAANVDCPTDEDGSVDLTVTGGVAPYTFEWKNAGGVVVSVVEDLANATPGTYTVRITDAGGLVLVRQYTVAAQSNFSINPQVTSNHGNFAVSCADGTDGTAVANITGQGDFDVVWESNGNTFVGANLQNAGPGVYTVTVTDELGCEITTSLTLNAPPAIVLNANVTAISCLGDKNGEIQVFAFGGVAGNYQYEWSTGIFGNLVRNLGTGDYTVTATDLNGCEKVETYTMAEPTPISVEFEIEPATEGFNGTIRAIVTGGQIPYRYEWVNLNSSEFTSIVSGLAPGEYFLIVTDDNGCTTSTLTAIVPDERYPCLEERVVITPDGNGTNDEFIIFCIGDLPNNNLEIYNRWGQLVFETENYDNSWAGTSQNGTPLPDGPYYYVLEYTNPDGTAVQAKGSLTIVRE